MIFFFFWLAFDVTTSYRKRDVETTLTLRSNNDLTLTKRRNTKQKLYPKSKRNIIHENKVDIKLLSEGKEVESI